MITRKPLLAKGKLHVKYHSLWTKTKNAGEIVAKTRTHEKSQTPKEFILVDNSQLEEEGENYILNFIF